MVEHHAATEPALSAPLTWSEICARYPDEWVALVEIDWVNENDLDFRSARVAGHGKTRREPLDQARPPGRGTRRSGISSPVPSGHLFARFSCREDYAL